jgi:hypothetical protein
LVPEPAATDAPEVSAPKVEAPKEAPKPDAPRAPGKLMIMSAAGRGWDHDDAGPEPQSEADQSMFGKRRLAALAAVVALAALAGAVGGAMATSGLQHFASNDAPAGTRGLEASVARIDADVAALKAGVEHSSKMGMSQFNKTSDRLDKFEKAQAESGARLAKLSETIEKLHVTPPATPVAAAASVTRDITGSITPPATAAVAAGAKAEAKAEVKPEVGRLPIVDSWVLQEVSRGGAWIEGRQGIYEVYAGDVVPGLGRIDAVRRQDGHWVVVTSRGLIVAR